MSWGLLPYPYSTQFLLSKGRDWKAITWAKMDLLFKVKAAHSNRQWRLSLARIFLNHEKILANLFYLLQNGHDNWFRLCIYPKLILLQKRKALCAGAQPSAKTQKSQSRYTLRQKQVQIITLYVIVFLIQLQRSSTIIIFFVSAHQKHWILYFTEYTKDVKNNIQETTEEPSSFYQ